jgi:hypothetical protein
LLLVFRRHIPTKTKMQPAGSQFTMQGVCQRQMSAFAGFISTTGAQTLREESLPRSFCTGAGR